MESSEECLGISIPDICTFNRRMESLVYHLDDIALLLLNYSQYHSPRLELYVVNI